MPLSRRLALGHLRIRPLSVVAAGLVIVAIDFRTRSVDFLPDVIGWSFVGAGAWMAGVRVACPGAFATALLSLSELSLPYHLVRFQSTTGEYVAADTLGAEDDPLVLRWDDLSQLRGAIIAAAMTLGAVTVVLLLRALAGRARSQSDLTAAHELRVAMVAPVLWAGPFVLVVLNRLRSGERYDPVWDGGAESAWLVALGALLGLATLFVLRRDRGWALRAGSGTKSRWQGTATWRAHQSPTG